MENKIPLLLLSLIAVVSILGMVKVLNPESTGQYQYAGGAIQYETTDVCTQVNCASGQPAELIRIDSSDYAPQFMLAQCSCPETPHILHSVKFIKPVMSYGY